MGVEILGLFSCIATNLVNIYMDDGAIIYNIERKNICKKDCWSYSDFGRCNLGFAVE